MKGADEYAPLFKTGQIGRFYIVSSSHARGLTFRIQLLPAGEEAMPNGSQNACLNKDAVEIYGIVGGSPGWTECYGWLHFGPWIFDFEKLVEERKDDIAQANAELHKQGIKESEEQRISRLLKNY